LKNLKKYQKFGQKMPQNLKKFGFDIFGFGSVNHTGILVSVISEFTRFGRTLHGSFQNMVWTFFAINTCSRPVTKVIKAK
jgi:hypothetical protein